MIDPVRPGIVPALVARPWWVRLAGRHANEAPTPNRAGVGVLVAWPVPFLIGIAMGAVLAAIVLGLTA